MKNSSGGGVNFAVGLLGIVLSCCMLFGCGRQEQAPVAEAQQQLTAASSVSNKEDPQWVFRSDPNAKVALVFVHGIFGDTLGTWTNDKGKRFFDYVRESPQMNGKADVFAFGFTSKMLGGGSLGVAEASKKLTEYLKFNHVLDYDSIVFVAHSMGGLVVMHNLIREDEIADKVPVVVLLGTPMTGATIAAVADKVANNSALPDMFGIDKNKFLQQLSDDWKKRSNKPTVICGYEKLETKGVLVVPWGSANYLCSKESPPMDGSSHLTMVKPDRPDHPAVVLVVNALNEFAFIDPKAKIETPDFVPEGDHLMIWMNADQTTARIVNASRSKVRYTIGQISPKLLIVPKTPRVLAAYAPENLDMYLLNGATQKEYSFVLEDDAGGKRKVFVRVKDINALTDALDQRVNKVVAAINTHLADENNSRMLAGLPSDDRRAADATARAAFETIKAPNVKISDSVRWLLAADALASAKLPQLSLSALRQAEAASPEIATTLAAQTLGGELAAESGVSSIFATVSTPKVEARTTSVREWSRTAKNGDVGALANRMQKIPALKASGLALEGDVLTARGQGDAARKAYMESSSIRETPGTTMRIKALDDKGAAKFSPSGGYVVEQARMRDKSIKATPGGDSASMKR